MCYILGDVPHQPVNTDEAMEHSQMANAIADIATDAHSKGQ
jgi:hypothetical protein